MDYQNGKIYTIRSHQTDKYYIGSTCSPLHKRLYDHKADYKQFLKGGKRLSSIEIVKYDDAYIELLELCPCNSRSELTKREGELIREHKNNIVNIKIDGRTKKEYRQTNKDIIREQKKEYYQENKERIQERDAKKEICDCGKSYTVGHKSRHIKSSKHIKFLEQV